MIDPNRNDTALPRAGTPLRKQWYLNANVWFLVFNAVFIIAFFVPLRDLVLTSLRSEYDSYIPFIPFISAYFLYLDRQKIYSPSSSFSVLGLILAGLGILLLFIGRSQAGLLNHRDYLSTMTFSAVTFWLGGFTFCYGIGSVRAALFPLFFLIFMVPIPGAALEEIILFLQSGSTEVSSIFFQATGVPAVRDGFIFYLPNLVIEVAKECSGIRSSLSLFITGILASYLFLRTGWARVLLLITVVPIAIVKNGMRIFTLATLGAYWDKRILASDLHTRGGFVFFIIALVLVGGVIVLLRKAEGRLALKNKDHGL